MTNDSADRRQLPAGWLTLGLALLLIAAGLCLDRFASSDGWQTAGRLMRSLGVLVLLPAGALMASRARRAERDQA